MLTQENRDDLQEKGYTVVPGVMTEAECDQHIASYRKWLASFPPGTYPQCKHSLVQKYRIGHMEPTWSARLKAYPVFSELWKTEKLLTSFDAVAIGRPPETGDEEFWNPEQKWLHVDQSVEREGLHAYQGAVYLEQCDEDDWAFEVVDQSHKVFDDLMDRLQTVRCTSVTKDDLEWLSERGCVRKRVSCPKGGMLLWDSRLIHANARPVKGRAHKDRWRFVVFVCMTPAAWAQESDIEKKVDAYNNLLLTGHWASMNIIVFSPKLADGSVEDSNPLESLPEVAKSETAKRLAGVIPYEENPDESPLPPPKFRQVSY